MPMTVVADQGTHLLTTDGTRYAVIERRSNSFYNCHDRTGKAFQPMTFPASRRYLMPMTGQTRKPRKRPLRRSPHAEPSLPGGCSEAYSVAPPSIATSAPVM